jgi:Na+/H+ antiporter NhaD/arsenite permease-like protein
VPAEGSKQPWRVFLEEEIFVLIAAVVAAALLLGGYVSVRRVPAVVDWELLLVLFALLVAVELVRESNLLARTVVFTVGRFRSARTLTFALVLLSGAMSALVTNDVALFVVIPFTVLAGQYTDFRVRHAVVLEIIAANLLGCLTPLGNPQNLFLYHQSGWQVGRFVATMAPFVAWSLVGILVAVVLMEPRRAIASRPLELPKIESARAMVGLACFALVVLEIFHLLDAWPAAIAAALATPIFLRGRFREMDLSIVPLFFFAFIIVEGLRVLPTYRLFERIPDEPAGLALYAGGILSSQVISNVPTAILMAPLAGENWKTLLYAVSAGGCGTIIASLANLLGWQIYLREHGPDRQFFHILTYANAAFLVWTAVGGWLLLG